MKKRLAPAREEGAPEEQPEARVESWKKEELWKSDSITFCFAADESNIVIVSKDSSVQIQETIEGIESRKTLALEVDVRSIDELKKILSEPVAHFGGIDILINNTSAPCFKDALYNYPEHFDLIKWNYYAL